ncbi:MAG: CheR family methyltransferase [Candidatus Methylumidiphilus sp.]
MWIVRQSRQLVKKAIGIDLETVGNSSLARGLKERMAKTGLTEEVRYFDFLQNSPKELEALVELIVVSETWFFRDEKPFNVLQQYVREEWLPSKPATPIKILSLPCSTGEEPYTIAMALLDIGLSPEQLGIDAFDISRLALEKARRAVYRNNSFRSRDLGFRDRYFQLTEEGYVLAEKVRSSIAFAQGNILAPGFASGKGPYHAVFFRNLMIYLAPAQQDEAMAVVDRVLSPSGILFVGHAESLQPINKGYAPVRFPFGFAYRKLSPDGQRPTPQRPDIRQNGEPSPMNVGYAALGASKLPRKPLEPQSAAAKTDALALAFEMADQGRTGEARKLCETAMESRPPRAAAYYLLGLLLEAQGLTTEAEKSLQKAVYLEPDHVDALAHLALATERRGDAKAAELIRQRVRRVEDKLARD